MVGQYKYTNGGDRQTQASTQGDRQPQASTQAHKKHLTLFCTANTHMITQVDSFIKLLLCLG